MTTIQEPLAEPYDAVVLREKAATAKSAVADLAGEMKRFATDRFGKIRSSTGQKLHVANDSVVEFVGKHPYKTIAAAAAVGLALGWVVRRK